MGGSSSKLSSTTFNKSVNDIFVNSIQQCSASGTSEQVINIIGNKNVTKTQMSQRLTLMQDCIQDPKFISKLQTDLISAIKASANAQNPAILGALGKSEAEVDTVIRNDVHNVITTTNMTRLSLSIKNIQAIYIVGNENVTDATMTQISDAVNKSTQSILNDIDSITKISNTIDASAEAIQENPISQIISSAFEGASQVWSSIIGSLTLPLLFIIVAGVITAYLYRDQISKRMFKTR